MFRNMFPSKTCASFTAHVSRKQNIFIVVAPYFLYFFLNNFCFDELFAKCPVLVKCFPPADPSQTNIAASDRSLLLFCCCGAFFLLTPCIRRIDCPLTEWYLTSVDRITEWNLPLWFFASCVADVNSHHSPVIRFFVCYSILVTRCGVSWHEDHVSLDCKECGGYAMSRPCPDCNGRCASKWTRNLPAVSLCYAWISNQLIILRNWICDNRVTKVKRRRGRDPVLHLMPHPPPRPRLHRRRSAVTSHPASSGLHHRRPHLSNLSISHPKSCLFHELDQKPCLPFHLLHRGKKERTHSPTHFLAHTHAFTHTNSHSLTSRCF